jgi:hypothetical protein
MQPYLPEFHTALITISGALMAVAGIITALLATREINARLAKPLIVKTLPFLIFSIVLGILAMWYAFEWFLTPDVTISFRAIYFLLGQAVLIAITLGVYTGALLFYSENGEKRGKSKIWKRRAVK